MNQGRRAKEAFEKDILGLKKFLKKPRYFQEIIEHQKCSITTAYERFKQLEARGIPVVRLGLGDDTRYTIM